MFSQISFTANPVLLIILWAVGLSMIALAGLIYLPTRVLMGISIAIIALHNLLDDVSAERFGRAVWIWDILYQRGIIAFDGIKFRPAYPVLPWIGVMAGGYCLGMVFDWDADRRRRFLVRLGAKGWSISAESSAMSKRSSLSPARSRNVGLSATRRGALAIRRMALQRRGLRNSEG
jgi:uncharacterized membrane protein